MMDINNMTVERNSQEACLDCNKIKLIYYTIIEPNIDGRLKIYTELNRKSKDDLVCSKHTISTEK